MRRDGINLINRSKIKRVRSLGLKSLLQELGSTEVGSNELQRTAGGSIVNLKYKNESNNSNNGQVIIFHKGKSVGY